MEHLSAAYSIFLMLSAGIEVFLGFLSLFRYRSRLAATFTFLCFSLAIYSFGYAMELLAKTPGGIMTWATIQYFGIPFIGTSFVLFASHFVSQGKPIAWTVVLPPLLISIVFLILRMTNPLHLQFYASVDFLYLDGVLTMTYEKGLWYWFFIGYNTLCLLIPAVLIAQYLASAAAPYRRQAGILLVGTLVPGVPYVLHVAGLVPAGVDVVPAGFAASAMALWVAVFRHKLLSLVPFGRHLLVETMADAVFVVDELNRVADANPAANLAFGIDGRDPVGLSLREAFPHLAPALNGEPQIVLDDRIWNFTRTPLSTEGRRTAGYLVVGRDVTEKERMIARLEHLARNDSLTGVLNRSSWNVSAETELKRLARHSRAASVIYLDLDNFKAVNDTRGHAAGDDVLVGVCKILRGEVRGEDLVGRYGGEEFVVFLPESCAAEAAEVAERLRSRLVEEFGGDSPGSVPVTGSFGVAGCICTEDLVLECMVNRADTAMYMSKRQGRNRVAVAPFPPADAKTAP